MLRFGDKPSIKRALDIGNSGFYGCLEQNKENSKDFNSHFFVPSVFWYKAF
jgi:hypothetical protein